MSKTIYLITGANRGIGRGLTEVFLARPDTIVIAAFRDPTEGSSKALTCLPQDASSSLIILGLDLNSPVHAATAISVLRAEHKIKRLDVVIANASNFTILTDSFGPLKNVSIPFLQDHVELNAYGPISLYQAVYPLLKKSDKPTFVGISSPLGSIDERFPAPYTAYGTSKAILHRITRQIHFENEEFISFTIDPGFVQTEMGNAAAEAIGLDKAPLRIMRGVGRIVATIDMGTRESVGGKLRVWDGNVFSTPRVNVS